MKKPPSPRRMSEAESRDQYRRDRDAIRGGTKPEQEDPLQDWEAGLKIDEHALEEALLQQPDLFYRVSKHLALLISQRDAAKQELAETEARVDAEIRHDAQVAEEKITEREVESNKRLHKNVQIAIRDLAALNLKVGQVSALKEAYQHRSYAIKDLVSLYIANYYSSSSEQGSARNKRSVDSQMAREGMSRMRRGHDD